MSRYDLIIFDFDGVVADSELLANTLLAEHLTSLGRPTTVDDSIRMFMGKRAEDIAALALDWLGRTERQPEHLLQFSETYRDFSRPRMREEVRPVHGITAFLDRSAHLARCIASSSRFHWLDHNIDKFGLRGHFGANVTSGSEVENGKPAPDIFLLAARRMGVQPGRAVVIEDSPAGVAGARAAGMTVIGFVGASHIRDGHQARLEEAGAHAIAADYGEVAALIDLT